MRSDLHFTIADDDQGVRSLIEVILKRAFPGCEISSFPDGLEAFQHIQKERVDMVITNHQMPRMNGMELTEKVRSVDERIPILMVSGTPHADKDAANAGATCFLYKMEIPKRLPEVVGTLLQNTLKRGEVGASRPI
jgi:DNA-binding NtrC family response regulator